MRKHERKVAEFLQAFGSLDGYDEPESLLGGYFRVRHKSGLVIEGDRYGGYSIVRDGWAWQTGLRLPKAKALVAELTTPEPEPKPEPKAPAKKAKAAPKGSGK
jgi:hypothetical protein